MVEKQLGPRLKQAREELLGGIDRITDDPLVREAFRIVDRRDFTPRGALRFAYKDHPIELDDGSSISQPSLVALMMTELRLNGRGRVLEVGTASGFGAALLSHCAAFVDTMDVNQYLFRRAKRTLAKLGFGNIAVHLGDGAAGLPRKAPYDAILVTAAAKKIPQALGDQLAVGGMIVLPMGEDPFLPRLVAATKRENGKIYPQSLFRVRFHPLISPIDGGFSWEYRHQVLEAKKRVIADWIENHQATEEEAIEFFRQSHSIPEDFTTLKSMARFIPIPPEFNEESE